MSFNIPGFDYPIPSGDKSLEMLRQLFGGVGQLGGQLGVMSDVFGLFNGAVMAVGSIVAFYLIVSAVVQTAHDGSVLGKRYSSLWVPIRGAGATAMLVPVFGGFSAVQGLVIAIAVAGVSLADKMTATGLDALMRNQGFVAPAVSQRKTGDELSKGVFSIAACMTANERSAARAGFQAQPVIGYKAAKDGSQVITFDETLEGLKTQCGEIIVGKNQAGSPVAGAAEAIQQAQATAAIEMFKAAKVATDSITPASASKFDYAQYREQAVAAHDKTLTAKLNELSKAAAATADSKHKAELEKIKQEGWVSLGGSALRLAAISSEIGQSIKLGTAEAAAFNSSIFGPADETLVKAERSLILATLNYGADSKIENKSNDTSADEGLGSKLKKKALEAISEPLYSAVESWVKSGNESGNALLSIKNKGDTLMDTGMDIILGAGLASLATFSMGWLMFALPIGMSIIMVGGMMAVWLPLIPWIFGISIALAYLVSVFEAMVASPLWMLMFYSGEGDGLREGDSAWKFLAATLLRPALTVLSFFAASILVVVVAGWATDAFLSLLKGVHNNNTGALPATIGYAYVYASTMILIANKSYRIMLDAPEAILKWLGSSLTGVSDDTSEVQQTNNLIMGHMSSAGKGAGALGGEKVAEGSIAGRGADMAKAGAAKAGNFLKTGKFNPDLK